MTVFGRRTGAIAWLHSLPPSTILFLRQARLRTVILIRTPGKFYPGSGEYAMITQEAES